VKFRGRGAKRLPEMERRRLATEATLARYRSKTFSWAEGRTCIHLAWCQLRNMGHRPPTLPRFRSALMAKRALAERGWESVSEMLEEVLGPDNRIAPAQMRLGDLAAFEGDAGLESLRVCCARDAYAGWSEGHDRLVVIGAKAETVKAAWRL
jgi:hypothetical protein